MTAREVVVAAVWRARPVSGQPAGVLAAARLEARRQLVEARFAAAHEEADPDPGRLDAEAALLHENLAEASRRLAGAGLAPVLIKSCLGSAGDEPTDRRLRSAAEYGDFDLVVGEGGQGRAVAALAGWGRPEPPARLEPRKVMVRPARGAGAHIHGDAEWFGVPVIRWQSLVREARPLAGFEGLLVPEPADALRIWVAHAVFQNLAFLLSELLEVRRLSTPETVARAARRAAQEGWGDAFSAAFAAASAAIAELDRGGVPSLPVPLPPVASLVGGWRHAGHLWVHGRRSRALRESWLRPAMVWAKRPREVPG